MHICVSKLSIIGSDNGLSPGWHQVIIKINAEIVLIEPSATIFSGISVENHTFYVNAFENGICKMVTILSRPQYGYT